MTTRGKSSKQLKAEKKQNQDKKHTTTMASKISETVVREKPAPQVLAPQAPAPRAPAPQSPAAKAPAPVRANVAAPQVSAPKSPAPQVSAPKSPAPVRVSAPAPQTPVAKTPAPQAPAPQAPQVSAPKAPAPVRAAASKAPAALPQAPQQLLESAAKTMERTFKAAGQGAVAVNCKLFDIARTHMTSGFELALDLATAKNPMEMVRVQMAFWDARMKALATQAQELRALSAEMVTRANEPIREHVKRS